MTTAISKNNSEPYIPARLIFKSSQDYSYCSRAQRGEVPDNKSVLSYFVSETQNLFDSGACWFFTCAIVFVSPCERYSFRLSNLNIIKKSSTIRFMSGAPSSASCDFTQTEKDSQKQQHRVGTTVSDSRGAEADFYRRV